MLLDVHPVMSASEYSGARDRSQYVLFPIVYSLEAVEESVCKLLSGPSDLHPVVCPSHNSFETSRKRKEQRGLLAFTALNGGKVCKLVHELVRLAAKENLMLASTLRVYLSQLLVGLNLAIAALNDFHEFLMSQHSKVSFLVCMSISPF